MNKQFIKIDENTIKVITTKDAIINTASYKINFLMEQKSKIDEQKQIDIQARDAELAEIDEIIDAFENSPNNPIPDIIK